MRKETFGSGKIPTHRGTSGVNGRAVSRCAVLLILLLVGFSPHHVFAKPIRECSAFRPNKHQEYVACPADVFIQHASGVQDWNITDGEVVTLVGKNLPANAAVFFQVACVGYYQESATANGLGLASFGPCTAVVDPSLGAMNCAFIYYLGPDGLYHTIAYHELTPI